MKARGIRARGIGSGRAGSRRLCGALVATLCAVATAASAATSPEAIYATQLPITPLISTESTVLLADGNVNGSYTDPTTTVGYLDGPEVAIFNWTDKQSQDCASGVSECADISSSEDFLATSGVTRPHWGASTNGKDEATIYSIYRAVARDYFDTYNAISTAIAGVANEDELAVLLNRPSTVCGGSGSCMRPWRSSDDKSLKHQIFRTVRPDGRNGGARYDERPKIFLGTGNWGSARIPIHEYGHYYNRVFAEKYGNGGGFNRQGPHEEQSLDEGLGYWYASDYTNTWYMGRGGTTQANGVPKYTDWVDYDPEGGDDADPHYLGDVVTSALWLARENAGCDKIGFRQTVLRLVDTIKGDAFGTWDAFGNGSIVRGFAHKVLDEAYASGACSKVDARAVIAIFREHELLPTFVDQTASRATNESGDTFGKALATGDFNGDGYVDLAAGSPGEDQDGGSDSGMVHVLYGSSSGIVALGYGSYERLDQTAIGSSNAQGDMFGYSLATADFDRDGYADLAVGLPYKDVNGAADAGSVDIFYGSSSGLIPVRYKKIQQETLGSTSESGDRFGYSLTAGDFNGDAFPDLAIGAPYEDTGGESDAGFLFVVFGSAGGLGAGGYERLDQETFGSTSEGDDRFTMSLAAGDYDADGYDDLAAGAPYEDLDGVDDAGFIFIAHGSAAGLHSGRYSRFSQTSMGSANEDGDRFGRSLAAGDFNGDGYEDLAAGSPFEDESDAADAGFLYIVFGRSSGLYPSSYEKLSQSTGGSTAESGDQYGYALAAGDTNADGIDDLAVGLPGEDTGDGNGAGFLHLYGGSTSGLVPVHVSRFSQEGFAATSGDADNFSKALAMGDFDRNGKADVAIGTPGKRLDDDTETGAVYLYRR
ncbi:MAG: FG-GAP repeat protein [Candidatus Schekmanbacteria bacterium]|nr:FG-GAP repeat protein [Candidatus Schekmanbacteria bacterium]